MRTEDTAPATNAAEVGDLQEALNSPRPGGSVYLPAGRYQVDETIRVNLENTQHLYLYGDGRASVIEFTATDGSPLLELTGVEDSWWPDLKITIRDLTLVGNYEAGDAFYLRWPNDTMIDGCFFQGFGGCAVVVTPNATNVTVRDCWMRDCKRMLHADNLHHLTFHGNQTRSSNDGQQQDEHIYIGKYCREVRIVSNHIAYGHNEAIILDGTAQHVIANNTIEGFREGIVATDSRDIIIDSNYLHCPTGVLLREDCRGFTVSGNMMTDNYDGAVRIADAGGSGGHVISGNIIRQSVYADGQKGIDLGDSTGCVVTDNVIEDTSDGPAIGAQRDANHTIANNQIRQTADAVLRTDTPVEPVQPDPESPFYPLYEHLREAEASRLPMRFAAIERIIGEALPEEGRESRQWWRNDPDTPQARAWMAAGWLVVYVKRIEGWTIFARY
ncbi:MAG: right-handed parallel beta-helix repeat-containing protein [Armatimonadota bacterium]